VYAAQKLRAWTMELVLHPFAGLGGFVLGVLCAVGAFGLDHIVLRHESAMYHPSPLMNLPLFLGVLLAAAALLWITVQMAVRRQLGLIYVSGICLGALAGFFVCAIAGALAG
jgi:hypothetical protein